MLQSARKLKISRGLRIALCVFFLLFCAINQGFAQEDHWQTLNIRVKNLMERQRYAEALPIAEASLHDAEHDFGPTDPRVALSLQNLAYLHVAQNDFEGGERMAQRALTIVQTGPSPDQRKVAQALNTISEIYEHHERLAEAESYAQKALEIEQKALPPDDPDLGMTLGNMATLYFRQFKYPKYGEAEEYYKRAIAILEKADGDNYYLSIVLGDVGRFYIMSGRDAEAVPLFAQLIPMEEALLGPDHPDVLVDRELLASCQNKSKQYADAERTYQRVLATELMKTDAGRARRIANTYDIVSQIQQAEGKDAQAEQSALQAVQVVEHDFSAQDPQLEQPLEYLARFYKDEKKYAAAEQTYCRLLGVTEKANPRDVRVVMILQELVKLAEEQGHLAESEPYHLRVIAFWDKSTQPDAAIDARQSYAALLHKLNREQEAAALDDQVREMRLKQQFAKVKDSEIPEMKSMLLLVETAAVQQGFGANYDQAADALRDYAALLRFKGRTVEAREIAARAQSMRDHTDYAGPESFAQWFIENVDQTLRTQANASARAQMVEALNRLAGLLRKVNRPSDASKIEEKAVQIRAKTSSP